MLFTEKNIASEDIKKWSPSYDGFFMKRDWGGGGAFLATVTLTEDLQTTLGLGKWRC